MKLDYVIRTATEKDVPEVYEMAKELAQMQGLLERFCVTPDSLLQMLNESPQNTNTIVALGKNSELLGFAMHTLIKNNRLYHSGFAMYIDELYVIPAARGHGIGKALFKYIASVAIHHQCNRMEWWVESENKSAMEFYDNLGARALEEFITYRFQNPRLKTFIES